MSRSLTESGWGTGILAVGWIIAVAFWKIQLRFTFRLLPRALCRLSLLSAAGKTAICRKGLRLPQRHNGAPNAATYNVQRTTFFANFNLLKMLKLGGQGAQVEQVDGSVDFSGFCSRRPSGPSYWGKDAKFGKLRKALMAAGLVQGGQEGQVVFEGGGSRCGG